MRSKRRNPCLIFLLLLISTQRIRLVRGFPSQSTAALTRRFLLPTVSHLSQPLLLRPRLAHPRPSIRLFAARGAAITVAERPYQLVIVESPSKCKTISSILQKYVSDNNLGYDYIVESSMGHIRNLPKSEKGATVVGVNIHHNYEPTYVLLPGKEALVKNLQKLAEGANKVILATDEDREGEAVAWHLTQVLGDASYERVTFTEITPTAIERAIQHPSTLNKNLVEAQETRRILDRLAGYTLSPILWKKIAPGLSAGRVQSVGMALIVARERERLLFQAAHYNDMTAEFSPEIQGTLMAVQGVPVATGSDFDNSGQLVSSNKRHWTTSDIEELKHTLTGGPDGDPNMSTWTVVSIQSKQRKQSSPMPFTTSTMQQEANRRLDMSVSQIMRCAQSLYEMGFISYMRTDSTHLSEDAHSATERVVSQDYGNDLIAAPRKGKQSKNAQEAHEAIRPAIQTNGAFLRPHQMTGRDNDPSLRLYELIYQRTVASRMVEQVANQTSVSIEGVSPDGNTTALFRVSGSVVVAPGFTLASGRSSTDKVLPPLVQGQKLDCNNLTCISHSTQPPPRYNEASFVKELEARGVGRPSTYAGTVQILRDRAYVGTPLRADDTGRRSGKERTGAAISAQRAAGGEEFTGGGRGPLVPSLSAFVVCSLLEKHCGTYVDPAFTASMEERLDQIARGEDGADKVAYLDEFYAGDDGLAAKVKRMDETVSANEARRADLPALFLNNAEDGDEIGLFIGPWGPYVQKVSANNATETSEKPPSASLPAGMAADLSTITPQTLNALLTSRERNGVLMGMHPDDERPIRLKIGRFGAYLQWGDDGEENTTTHSLPKHLGSMRNLDIMDLGAEDFSLSDMIDLSQEEAIGYVNLPRTVSTLNGLPIIAAIGPYGPYLKYNASFVSLNKKDGDVLTVDAETAERVVTEGVINKSSKSGRDVIAELGEKDGAMVQVKDGRFGVYINWKKVNAKLPVEYAENPEKIPLEEAWSLIQEKGGKPKTAKAPQVELPPAPKRPKSAYLHFCAEKRLEVAAKVQSLGGVSKELARLWADTSDRQSYEDSAAEEKGHYEEKKRVWQKECQAILDKSSTRSSKQSIKKQAPKRPKSAYLFFCADKRPQVTATSLGDISKELAQLWAEAADDHEERKKYQELAAADKKTYEQEILQHNGKVNGIAAPKKAVVSKKAAVRKKPASTKATPNKTRAPSAYMLFCSENRKTIVDNDGEKLPFGETTKRLAQLWKECDEDTRRSFEDQAARGKQVMES